MRWQLDNSAGVARLEANGLLNDLTVPLRPMLGMIGVAPDLIAYFGHLRWRSVGTVESRLLLAAALLPALFHAFDQRTAGRLRRLGPGGAPRA